MNIEGILPDDLFDAIEAAEHREAAPAGSYQFKVNSDKTKVFVTRAGNRQLGISIVPVADTKGNAVSYESMYHKVPLEGKYTNRKGEERSLLGITAGFFSNLGLDREDVRALIASALEVDIPADAKGGTDVQLLLASGEFAALKDTPFGGKIEISTYEGKEYANIKETWRLAEGV